MFSFFLTESRISVCPVVWQAILAVERIAQAESAKTPMLSDLLTVMQIMRRKGAFLFSAAAQIPPTANQQQQMQLREEAFPPDEDVEHKPGLSPLAVGSAIGCSVWQRGLSAEEIGDINAPSRIDLGALSEACKMYTEAKHSAYVSCSMPMELHSLMLVNENAVADLEAEKARYAEQRSGIIASSAIGQMMQQQRQQQKDSFVQQQQQTGQSSPAATTDSVTPHSTTNKEVSRTASNSMPKT